MRLRSLAFVLALMLAATPVLGVVCEMDCEQPSATPACHSAAPVHDGLTLRGHQHDCARDHASGTPALLAGTSARDAGRTFVAIFAPTLAQASVIDARVALLVMHGPPGLSGRISPSYTSVLRI